jgi:hypothetical protein
MPLELVVVEKVSLYSRMLNVIKSKGLKTTYQGFKTLDFQTLRLKKWQNIPKTT